jgi:catechol 2,3-dioxygenase-like lactoylglutathione lyase family enzyme
MRKTVGSEFKLRRVKHVELVCRDMARTEAFYRDALGMRPIRTFDLPAGGSQRVVFDVGEGARLAFLWFPAAREAEPNTPSHDPGLVDGSLITAYGSIEHVTFEVSVGRFNEYAQRLKDAAVPASLAFNHDEPLACAGGAIGGDAWGRSLHCLDPDGISLEFACWPRPPEEAPQTTQERTAAKRPARRLAAPVFAPA